MEEAGGERQREAPNGLLANWGDFGEPGDEEDMKKIRQEMSRDKGELKQEMKDMSGKIKRYESRGDEQEQNFVEPTVTLWETAKIVVENEELGNRRQLRSQNQSNQYFFLLWQEDATVIVEASEAAQEMPAEEQKEE
ncbi:hypothetical protein JD844_033809 [Phrynosoma platyrhinos]|uniref:Uncharacterized protein n=1 Tax=Phrynosoma platyrhinos TaxID=52577 RepID=A0ABQ7T6D7_PHRPL|nr:hypothetical protein JD844_033809 [Phrynosoma platyrhinos]